MAEPWGNPKKGKYQSVPNSSKRPAIQDAEKKVVKAAVKQERYRVSDQGKADTKSITDSGKKDQLPEKDAALRSLAARKPVRDAVQKASTAKQPKKSALYQSKLIRKSKDTAVKRVAKAIKSDKIGSDRKKGK
jgi:Tfp pilus assembly protein PilE